MGSAATPSRGIPNRLKLKTILCLFIMVTMGPLGSVLLRAGMRHDVIQVSLRPMVVVPEFLQFLSNVYIWLGILGRIISGFAFVCLLSWADYSYVNPASSVAYVIAVFFGWSMLGEVVPLGRWIGAIVIGLGVVLVGATPARTVEVATKGSVSARARHKPSEAKR